MNIIGIDPGLTGAVAALLLHPQTSEVGSLFVWDTPVEEIKRRNKVKNDFLPHEMARILRVVQGYGMCEAYIEQVGAMPGQGVTSMFGFGKGYGMWIGVMAALGIPYSFVTPQAWKKKMMAGKADKDAARGVAQQLFPKHVDMLVRKKDIGRADALLIAEWGRRAQIGHDV